MTAPGTKASRERHVWFDDWMGIRGAALRQLCDGILTDIEAAEVAGGHRKRRRRPTDQAHHETAVEVVVANIAHAVVAPPPSGRLAILTGNGCRGATRYDNKALGKPLRELLARLDEMGLIEWHYSLRRLEASSIAPTEAFARRVVASAVTLADFGRVGREETVIVTRKRKTGSAERGTRKMVDYAETAATRAMRARMESLNAWISAADITFVDDGLDPVDPYDRFQRRHFSTVSWDSDEPAFDLTGRLFGGFWQTLRSTRRGNIRIDGEPVAVLDFSSLYPRLAHAHVGAVPPSGDLYAVEGLEAHRKAVKRALNCLIMDDFHRSRWPEEFTSTVANETDDPSALLPEGWGVKRFKRALLGRHAALAPCLGQGLGLRLMHTESEILLDVLEELRSRGIVALGLHDGLLVRRSVGDQAREVMEKVARDRTMAVLPVTIS